MTDSMITGLVWSIVAIALFSFLSVAAWTSARRREREAYYKGEAIKKIAEMQGPTPEPVLQVLRETMAAWKEQPSAANMGPAQARAYYKAEAIKRIAEMPGADADAILTVLREEERVAVRRIREGLRLAGIITTAVGIGLTVVLAVLIKERPVYLVGFIPALVGITLFGYAYIVPRQDIDSRSSQTLPS